MENDVTCWKMQGHSLLLSVKLQPRGSKNEVGQVVQGQLKVKVTSPPVDNAANEALVEVLSDYLDCHKRHLQIVKGQTSRNKVVEISDPNLNEISKKLTRLA